MIGSPNRRKRRHRRHEIRELSDRASALHEQLLASEELTRQHESRSAELIAGAHEKIEEYVESQARVFDLDDSRAGGLEDPRLIDLLVQWRWRGVQTVEQAKEELLHEVARRSVGKTDVALLLSSVDHTAIALYGRMPDSLRSLHGDAFIDEAVRTLTIEDFAATLVQDPNWATMRTRWLRLGWRGATNEATFNGAYIRDVIGRVAMIHDARGDDVVQSGLHIHDTIIDKELQRVMPAQREQMTKAFQERLEREYESLPKIHEKNAPADAVEAIVSGSQARPVVAAAYSDHALMRHGRELWDGTYANGLTDDEVRDRIRAAIAAEGNSLWSDEMSLFTAKWAVHAFQRLMTSHTFAAALMCSDMQREVLEGIEEQWDAFLVLVPNGMLPAGGFEFSRILVASYQFGAWLGLLAPDGAGFRLLVNDASSLSVLLASDEADLAQDSPAQRCMVLAKRLVAGLLLNLQGATTHKIRRVEARLKNKGREAEPEHRIVTIGAPVDIDCRPAIREYIENGVKGSRRHGAPTVQVMVRGHYRMQACGPHHSERRKTWIRPHWWGSEAALIQTRAKVPS